MAKCAPRTVALCGAVVLLAGCGTSQAGVESSSGPTGAVTPDIEPPCDTGIQINTDGPVYSTMGELSQASDEVVKGLVTEQRCVPGTVRGHQEIHYLVSEIAVEQAWSGEMVPPESLTVVQLPGQQENSTPLTTGDDVVLFLSAETPGDPTLEKALGSHWTPLGWDNGIADVDPATETLIWRSPLIDEGPVFLSQMTSALAP